MRMRYYSVHAPYDGPDDEDRFAFVKDGFSWPALLVPVLWILWHRLWLALVWYIVFLLIVAWTGRLITEDAAFTVAVLGSLLFAFEANNFRRFSLAGRDWEEVGWSFGRNITEAEARFFADSPQPAENLDRRAAMLRAAHVPDESSEASDEPILGLFPEPER